MRARCKSSRTKPSRGPNLNVSISSNGRRDASTKRAFSRHSAYSLGSVRILHHRPADAEFAAPSRNRQCANGDIEARRAVGREDTDGAAIDAARALFQFGDNFHGADFRRAGDRAAGKQRADDSLDACPGFQLRRHRGNHLMHRRIGFHGEEIAGHRRCRFRRCAPDRCAANRRSSNSRHGSWCFRAG